MKICFICSANICRSFIAQELLKDLLKKNNKLNIDVISRGIYVLPYIKVPEKIKQFLFKNNIIYTDHVPTQYSKQDLISSNLILVMTKEQYDEIIDKYAEFSNKIHMISKYVLNKEKNIDDPISLEGKKFEKSINDIKKLIYSLYNTKF